ncbi:hypothetical protein [Halobellus inordinatus]|uniref:hypothetical protein n=1 Tax=Halobellus inordinatus TaxID=1126236 RepID=UPI00211562A3|nr:hypothetical protein [Halobellus ramosii]
MDTGGYEIDFTREYGQVRIQKRIYGRRGYPWDYLVLTSPEYFTEEIDFVRQEWHQARSLATILNLDYQYVAYAEDGMIPQDLAIEGKPAIATYLCGVHEYTTEHIAEMMEIQRETVVKYLARFDPLRRSE